MDIRDRILDAAKRVYAQHGFRGATTRLIAIEAGVNEVTLFRTFGSKAALFEAFMQAHVSHSPIPHLPDPPADPEREMTAWVATVIGHLRENRALIRTSFGEIEERPEAAVSMCEGPNCAGMILTDYVLRLQSLGIASADGDIPTAVAMLMSSMIGDAISRDVMPNAFPQPESDAPRKYVCVFLRALGVVPLRRPSGAARSAETAVGGRGRNRRTTKR
jgi:AcrR family transcriptional regulator